MHRLEERRLSFQVFTHLALHARHVIRVHQRVPVERDIVVIDIIAKHGLPARGQLDAFGLAVEVPDAVIGGHVDKLAALVDIAEYRPVVEQLQARRQGRTD